jgi:hypothetical protein
VVLRQVESPLANVCVSYKIACKKGDTKCPADAIVKEYHLATFAGLLSLSQQPGVFGIRVCDGKDYCNTPEDIKELPPGTALPNNPNAKRS